MLSVYPNPFISTINLNFNEEVVPQDYKIKIYDLLGRVHYQATIVSSEMDAGHYTIDLAGKALKPGTIYLLLVESSNGGYKKVFRLLKGFDD